jgi:hypothetical protein
MAITLAEAITQVREKRLFNFDNYDATGGIYRWRYNGIPSTIDNPSHNLAFEFYDGPWSFHSLSELTEIAAASKARARDMTAQIIRGLVEYWGFAGDPPKGTGGGWNVYVHGFTEVMQDAGYTQQTRDWATQIAYDVSVSGSHNTPWRVIPSHEYWPLWTNPNGISAGANVREFSVGVRAHMLLRDLIPCTAPNTNQMRDDYIYNCTHEIIMLALDHFIDWTDNATYADIWQQQEDQVWHYWPLFFAHMGRTLIEYYESDFDSTLDAEILQKLPYLVDAWWDRFYLANDPNSRFGLNYAFQQVQANNVVAPDLQLLWAPLFAWVYSMTGSQTAKDRSLTLFESGINWAYWASTGKQYMQQGWWSEQGFTWLSEEVPTPPTADRVRLIIT